jgi:FkbM family methyltransferase
MSTLQKLWLRVRGSKVHALGQRAAARWPFPVSVTVDGGQHMYVDLRSAIGRGLFVSGKFDMAAIKPALDALSPGATFIDVGANIGFYSVLAHGRVGPAGRVYSFEMDPRPLRCLRKTVTKFGLRSINVIEAAVADQDGRMSFTPKVEHGHNHIERSGGRGRSVRSLKLDTWAADAGLQRVDVIKVDVEGAEKFVLAGARQTISRFKPLVLCEADMKTASTFNYTPDDLIDQLKGMGYRTTWLDGVHTPTLLARPEALA